MIITVGTVIGLPITGWFSLSNFKEKKYIAAAAGALSFVALAAYTIRFFGNPQERLSAESATSERGLGRSGVSGYITFDGKIMKCMRCQSAARQAYGSENDPYFSCGREECRINKSGYESPLEVRAESFEAMTLDKNDTLICDKCNADVESDRQWGELTIECGCGNTLYQDDSYDKYDMADFYAESAEEDTDFMVQCEGCGWIVPSYASCECVEMKAESFRASGPESDRITYHGLAECFFCQKLFAYDPIWDTMTLDEKRKYRDSGGRPAGVCEYCWRYRNKSFRASGPTHKYMNKKKVDQLLQANGGKIFNVTFIKRDGSKRTMTCRGGVKKYTKGVGLRYNPKAYDLRVVFDLGKMQYRMIPIDRVISLRIGGTTYKAS